MFVLHVKSALFKSFLQDGILDRAEYNEDVGGVDATSKVCVDLPLTMLVLTEKPFFDEEACIIVIAPTSIIFKTALEIFIGDLLFEEINLVKKEHYGGGDEPWRVADLREEENRLVHAVL